MSNPLVHCSSCTLGVGRPRSVKFAPVRTRWKGGGACELSSAELPLIRRFALLRALRRFAASACDVRVWLSSRVMGSYTLPGCVWATDRCASPARLTCELLRSIEIAKTPAKLFGAFIDRQCVPVVSSR